MEKQASGWWKATRSRPPTAPQQPAACGNGRVRWACTYVLPDDSEAPVRQPGKDKEKLVEVKEPAAPKVKETE